MLGWNFSLYDPSRPARGVVVSMINGENTFCPRDPATGIPRNRTFSVELLCANVAPQANYGDASVVELNSCDYRMTLKSIAGCPLECLSSGSICGTHGVCGFDTDLGKSRCYCYTGFQGDDCATPIADAVGMGAETVILIVVCIVLCAVIALVAFMFLKLRKLQVDPAAYGELQGRFNELGMLA
jgi:cbb3-type cytochrome oxidase subunit 3